MSRIAEARLNRHHRNDAKAMETKGFTTATKCYFEQLAELVAPICSRENTWC